MPASALAEQTGVPANIVVLGDSLSAGYGLQPGESFPERLQDALSERGVAAKIIGAGVSGDTTSGGLARLDWSVPEGTDGVILELGANDGLRGLPVPTMRANLVAMIERLQERDIAVLLTGMRAPPSMGDAYAKEFDATYPTLSDEYELMLYPFFLDGVAAEASLNQADGIHPTAEGIDVIVERI
ncbi:MAG: arylesterase, partial [Pseudomonadota bacterium]